MHDKLMGEARAVLRERFGFDAFRPGQEAVITQLLRGKSALAVFPTGAGKSLCYQLPALLLEGVTLVVSPLIALMKDQVDFLTSRQIPAARLDSTVSREEFEAIQEGLNQKRLRLLYVAPERFSNERFLARLKSLQVALLVIDEAHCISEWGHNFRPDYLKLAGHAKELNVPRVLALTATATRAVADDICRQFSIEAAARVNTGFYRPNLFLRATATTPEDRLPLLIEKLKGQPTGPTIVYVTLQKTAETVATALVKAGFSADSYHAGMEAEERDAVQNRFMASDSAIVVATIAFGMGIDKANIRAVYHFNLPKSQENYSQEIGRAGRDGVPSHCEILASAADLTILENFTYGDTPAPEALASLVNEILGGRGNGELFNISTYDLSNRHDIRQLVVTTALTYLELAGLIESTAPFYTSYQWKYQKNPDEIVARFDDERKLFLTRLFRAARVGKTWCTLEIAEALSALSEPRERIVKALTYLEEKGEIELRATGVRQGYRVTATPRDLNQVTDDLRQRFALREASDVKRVASVAELLSARGCLVRRLLNYFGEELGRNCGHCGPCRGEGPVVLKRKAVRYSLERDAEFNNLCRDHPKALFSARQIARFLCGISSPAIAAAKLTRHPRFGSAAAVPFDAVLRAANTDGTSNKSAPAR